MPLGKSHGEKAKELRGQAATMEYKAKEGSLISEKSRGKLLKESKNRIRLAEIEEAKQAAQDAQYAKDRAKRDAQLKKLADAIKEKLEYSKKMREKVNLSPFAAGVAENSIGESARREIQQTYDRQDLIAAKKAKMEREWRNRGAR